MNNASPLEALKAGFRKACVKRLVGDENGAVDVLTNEIPKLVVAWAKTTAIEPSEKKSKLKELFDDESARAEELALAFDIFAARFEIGVAKQVEDCVRNLLSKIDRLSERLELAISNLPSSDRKALDKCELIGNDEENERVSEPEVNSKAGNNISLENENNLNLDIKVNKGLIFDDIEGMIDELLSNDN